MMYFYLKMIHIVLGGLLFAAGIGPVVNVLLAHRAGGLADEYRALCLSWRLSWLLVIPLGIVQALIGFSIILIKGYAANNLWVLVAYIGFFVAAILWVVSLFFQMQCKDLLSRAVNNVHINSREYHNYFRTWLLFGGLAVLVLLIMIFFMANKIG